MKKISLIIAVGCYSFLSWLWPRGLQMGGWKGTVHFQMTWGRFLKNIEIRSKKRHSERTSTRSTHFSFTHGTI